MSVMKVTTRITHRYLMRKSKYELAFIIMANIDKIDLFAEGISPLHCDCGREKHTSLDCGPKLPRSSR